MDGPKYIEFKNEDLVDNEKLILSYLKENYTLREIAHKMGLKKAIIKAHVKNLMQKMQVKDIKDISFPEGL